MPTNEEHSDFTYDMHGVRASDIHQWMDAPWEIYGRNHRRTRHNTKYIPPKFIDKYGKERAQAIMEDHIILDNRSKTLENRGFKASHKRTRDQLKKIQCRKDQA